MVYLKYTALLAQEMSRRGWKADFRATGQTGILIADSGVALDSVVADFVAGTAETLSPVNTPDHWDVSDGQGSLFHAAYAGVTLALVHGSQPDAMVLCHDPVRRTINEVPHYPLVPLLQAVHPCESAARLTNSNALIVGVALDTSNLSSEEAEREIKRTENFMKLPCVYPIRIGVEGV